MILVNRKPAINQGIDNLVGPSFVVVVAVCLWYHQPMIKAAGANKSTRDNLVIIAVELAYAYRGQPGTVHIGRSTYHMLADHLYVINSEVVHIYETFLDEDNQIVTLLLPASWLRNAVADEQLPVWGPLDLDLQSAVYQPLAKAVQTLVAGVITPSSARSAYLTSLGAEYQLVGQLLKHLTVNGQVTSDQLPLPAPLRQAVTELQENYAQPVSIANLAEQLNYSSVYFSRYFKDYMGISPKAYLGQIRLERATSLLMTSQDSI